MYFGPEVRTGSGQGPSYQSGEKGVGSVEKLYEDLYNGAEIEFDLAKSSRPSFDMRNDFSVETRRKFVRKIKC